MELASRIRWILVLAVGVILLIFVGWGLFSIASSVFEGEEGNDSSLTEPTYNVKSTVTARFKLDGPVVASEAHRSYTIDVSERVVTMKVYKNYGQTVIAEKSYTNTVEGFDAFMQSLAKLDVTARKRNTSQDDDNKDVGVCPRGNRYILELDGSIRRWSTSCSTREGTAGFTMNDVQQLFQLQIPDYYDLVRGTGL